jgi:hypothetical protein
MLKFRPIIMIVAMAVFIVSAGCAVYETPVDTATGTVADLPQDDGSGDSPFAAPADDGDDGLNSGDDTDSGVTPVDPADGADPDPAAADDPVEIVTKDSDIDKEANEGEDYSQLFDVKGGSGDYAWTLDGTLPAGLDLIPVGDKETISGTLEAGTEGDYSLTLTVKDAADSSNSDSISFTLNVIRVEDDDDEPGTIIAVTPVFTVSELTMRLIKAGAPDADGYGADVLADIASGTPMSVQASCGAETELVFAVTGTDSSSLDWEIEDSISYNDEFKDLMDEIGMLEEQFVTKNPSWFDEHDYVADGVTWDAEKSELHAVGSFCTYNAYGTHYWDYLADNYDADLDYDASINPIESLTITIESGEKTASATIKFNVAVALVLDEIEDAIEEAHDNDQIPLPSDEVPGNAPGGW